MRLEYGYSGTEPLVGCISLSSFAYQPESGFFIMDNEMNKRPSLQFYPADWLKDPDLQMCSMNTIGIWINLMCRMWEAKEEGILCGIEGELALLVGAKPSEFKRFLKEAEIHKFCDVLRNVTNSYNIVTIKCRRMNKLFLERKGAKTRMQRYREKQDNADVTLPSSSSTSTSKNYMSIFHLAQKEFYGTKRGTQTEFDNLRKKHKDWEKVLPLLLPAIRNQIANRERMKLKGEFVPPPKNFKTWINNRCWEETIPEKQKSQKNLCSCGCGKEATSRTSDKYFATPECRIKVLGW